MTGTIYRKVSSPPPVRIVGGGGPFLNAEDGRSFLDLASNACCTLLGINNQTVIHAIMAQADELPQVFAGAFRTKAVDEAGEAVAREFEAVNPGWFGGVIFQNGGSEAVDLACKLAAQYHAEAGDTKRVQFGVREFAYHGITTLPASLSGHYPRYKLMDSYQEEVEGHYICRLPHPFQNGSFDVVSETGSACLEENHFGSRAAAVVIEPVGGPPLGAWVDTVDYLQTLRQACDKNGCLLIYDEVLCGSGRCGAISTAARYGVWPDIIVLGKGLSAGYQPVSAIVLSEKVAERIRKGSDQIMFGTAFGAHTIGCAAVKAALDYVRDRNLYEQVRDGEEIYETILREVLRDHTVVSEVRGMGALWGLELRDPETGDFFDPMWDFHQLARERALDRNVVVYSKGQTVFGEGDFITIAPSIEIEFDLFEQGVVKLADGIRDAYDIVKLRR